MFTEILKTSTVVAAKGRMWCDMGGEAVILNIDSGVYYGLNPVGARVWELIQRPMTVEDLLRKLLEIYEVSAERCESELFSLLQDLATNHLIEVEAKHYEAN